uniref:Uncharacterized protein n=1 Tax=Anguilla anguilla TaxID=7936 RepID=A0A0E9R9B7_ANGAN
MLVILSHVYNKCLLQHMVTHGNTEII